MTPRSLKDGLMGLLSEGLRRLPDAFAIILAMAVVFFGFLLFAMWSMNRPLY